VGAGPNELQHEQYPCDQYQNAKLPYPMMKNGPFLLAVSTIAAGGLIFALIKPRGPQAVIIVVLSAISLFWAILWERRNR
jgi:hypothetical protein